MRKASWLMPAILVAASFTAAVASDRWTETGLASWYGPGFAGKPTASTEIYDPNAMTAAHKTLPLGSIVRVVNLENSRKVILRINDRGPFKDGRIIDVSRAAAQVLDFHDDGLAKVRIEVIGHQYPSQTSASQYATAAETAVAVANAPVEDNASPVTEDGVVEDTNVTFAEEKRGFTEESLPPPAAPAVAATAAAAGDATPAAETAPAAANVAPGTESVSSPVDAPASIETSAAEAHTTAERGEHFLQIGAFDQEQNAWPALHKAQALGLNGQVQGTDGKYRALVGPFASLADARDVQARLKDAGIDSFVRRP